MLLMNDHNLSFISEGILSPREKKLSETGPEKFETLPETHWNFTCNCAILDNHCAPSFTECKIQCTIWLNHESFQWSLRSHSRKSLGGWLDIPSVGFKFQHLQFLLCLRAYGLHFFPKLNGFCHKLPSKELKSFPQSGWDGIMGPNR